MSQLETCEIIPEKTTLGIEKNNQKTSENILEISLDVVEVNRSSSHLSNKKECVQTEHVSYDAYDQIKDLFFDSQKDALQIKENINFFPSSEAKLCGKILRAIREGSNSIFVPLPLYAQDAEIAGRISNYLGHSKARSLVVNAEGKSTVAIITDMAYQLGVCDTQDLLLGFVNKMRSFFEQNLILHIVLYRCDHLTAQDYGYLYELATVIFEKYPKEKGKCLIRYVFIGSQSIEMTLRKKVIGTFKKVPMNTMRLTDCMNALYLYTASSQRNELFHQMIAQYGYAAWIASCGYPALLRKILPIPLPESNADKQNPEQYLVKIIDAGVEPNFYNQLQDARSRMKQLHYLRSTSTLVKLAITICVLGLFLGLFMLR